MSRNQRIGLIVAAVAVAVRRLRDREPGRGRRGRPGGADRPTTTADRDRRPATDRARRPRPRRRLRRSPRSPGSRSAAARSSAGPPRSRSRRATPCVIVVSADAPDDIHLHGYDIEKEVEPGQPATLQVQGRTSRAMFEIESHVAEDAGRDPLVGDAHSRTQVTPPVFLIAHGISVRSDLPIPEWLFGWAAAMVLVVSFVALAVLWPEPRLQKPTLAAAARRDRPRAREPAGGDRLRRDRRLPARRSPSTPGLRGHAEHHRQLRADLHLRDLLARRWCR